MAKEDFFGHLAFLLVASGFMTKKHRIELINRDNFVVEVAEDDYILDAIDLIHPLIYSLLFASLFFLLYRQTRFHNLLYLPLAMGALDYLENIFLFLMVNSYPNISPTVIQMASLLSVIKNVVQYLTIAAFLVGIVAFLVRRVRR